MSEIAGIQQVLQLTPIVERAATAMQPHPGDMARAFERELVKLNQEAHEKTQESLPSHEIKGFSEDEEHPGGRPPEERRRRRPGEPEPEERQIDLIAESGHGGLLDIKA
ncbi:MAG: hypothetical protein HQK87_06630 [Nitrospinae bacterium]|nr:hypothetical protein [Nitrospinota bacterium]